MNVYVIHSSANRDQVNVYIDELKRSAYNLNTLIPENGGIFWKIDAALKIKKAQMLVFFVGEKSHESPYIGWELETAIKYKKPVYTIKLHPDYKDHPALAETDSFSGQIGSYDKAVTFGELAMIINDHENGHYKIFNQEPEQIDQGVLLEQYKLFLQTSEDLVTRRQNVNNFYITINSALIAILSALLTFSADEESIVVLSSTNMLIISMIFAAVGMIFCWSWRAILKSYGRLNSSKMKIISSIEKQLPASLYDAEWAVLSDRLNKKKYVSFTESETRIPLIFMFLYGVVFVVWLLLLIG